MSKDDYPISQKKHAVHIDTYIQNLDKLFLSGKATEHSYRSDLQVLLSELLPDCQVTNKYGDSQESFLLTRVLQN